MQPYPLPLRGLNLVTGSGGASHHGRLRVHLQVRLAIARLGPRKPTSFTSIHPLASLQQPTHTRRLHRQPLIRIPIQHEPLPLGRREPSVGDAVGVLPQQPLHRRRRPVRCPAPPARPSTAFANGGTRPRIRIRPLPDLVHLAARRGLPEHAPSPNATNRGLDRLFGPGEGAEAPAPVFEERIIRR